IGATLNAYVAEVEAVSTLKDDLVTDINNRKKNEAEQTRQLIMIKDLKDFVTRSNLEEDELRLLLEEGPTVGIHFIVCGDYSFIGSSYELAPKYVRRQSTIGLSTMKLGDQDMFSQPF